MDASTVDIRRLVQSGDVGWADLSPKARSRVKMAPPGAGAIIVEKNTGCILVSSDGRAITRTRRVLFRPGIRLNQGDFREHVSYFEGNVSFMYLDVGGNVTVGLGHLLKNAVEAKALQFLRRRTNEFAHDEHVENAFNLVKNSGLAGAPASKFNNLTHIDLSRTAIEILFQADVDEFVELLKNEFKGFNGYETYPGKVQLAMLDMAYTMGTKKFSDKFVKFRAALELRNWFKVADESERSDKDKHGNEIKNMPERNTKVRKWILEAIKEQPFFINLACIPKPI